MKKFTYFTTLVTILGIGYLVFYINSYNIPNRAESVESNLKDWLNRGETQQLNPTLIEKIKIADTSTHIGLFQLENKNIGYVRLDEGLNGRLKITQAGHGTNEIQYQDIHTNRGLYYILVGKNQEKLIDQVQVKLMHEDYDFKVNISTEELFVRYHKLPKEFDRPFPAELTMFDENNNVIE